MHVDRARSGLFVKAVYILGDQQDVAGKIGLQPRQRVMGRVRLSLCRLNPTRVIEAVYEVGIAHKGLWCGNILNPVLRPQTSLVAERAQPAFRRYPGPGQNDDPVDPSHRFPFSSSPQPTKSRA